MQLKHIMLLRIKTKSLIHYVYCDIIVVPEKSITLTDTKSDEETSVIECAAQGVFPEPTLKLLQGSETDMWAWFICHLPTAGYFLSARADEDEIEREKCPQWKEAAFSNRLIA